MIIIIVIIVIIIIIVRIVIIVIIIIITIIILITLITLILSLFLLYLELGARAQPEVLGVQAEAGVLVASGNCREWQLSRVANVASGICL